MGSIEMSCSASKIDRVMEEIMICTEMLAKGDFDIQIMECARQSRLGALCELADSPESTSFINATRAAFGEDKCFEISAMVRDYLAVSKYDIMDSAKEFLDYGNFKFTTLTPIKNK